MAKSKGSEPYIKKSTNLDGTTSFLAQVNVKGFKRVSKAHSTRKAALAWRDTLTRELRKHRERGGVRGDIATLTISQLATEYLEDSETKLQKAYADRSRSVAWWVNNYGAERVANFNVLKARAARDRLKPGRENATVNRYLAGIRACWNWGRAAGLIAQDLRWPSRLMLTEPRGRTRFLSDEEIENVLKAATKLGPTMRAAVLVSIGCGLRKGELLRLKWGDVDFDAETLRILLTKNSEPRGVHLPASAAAALRALKKSKIVALESVFLTENGEPAWQGWIEYRWRQIRTAAGLRDFRWHDLRHSCASILAQNGASLIEIGSVLGHKSPSVTARYSHLVHSRAVTGHAALDAKLTGK